MFREELKTQKVKEDLPKNAKQKEKSMFLFNRYRPLDRVFLEADSGGDNGGNGGEPDPQPTVLKSLFDKTSSEYAEAKRQIKRLEDQVKQLSAKGKTDEQLRAEALEEANSKYAEVVKKLNKANATSIIAETKAKIALDAKDTSLEDLLELLITDDEEKTNSNAILLNKLVSSVYSKGFNDAKRKEHKAMKDGIVSTDGGGNVEKDNLGWGAKLAGTVNKSNAQKIKDFYK